MITNRLYIKVDDEWKELDLFENISIPTTFAVDTLRLGEKSTGYSLDFTLPGTSNNAQALGLVADINAYRGSFEIEKNYDALLTDDSVTVFNGQFRLKKVIKKHSREITYQGCLFGGVKNFIDALGTDKLLGNEDPSKDLNFSNWTTPAEDMTLSGFVDKLQSFDTGAGDWGMTLIDKTNKYSQSWSSNTMTWQTTELTPYLPVKAIFDKIIAQTGWTYESDFLEGENNYIINNPRWVDNLALYDIYYMIYPYMRHNSNIKSSSAVTSTVSQANQNSSFIQLLDWMDDSNFVETDASNYLRQIANHNGMPLTNPTYNNYSLSETGVTGDITNYAFTAPSSGMYTVKFDVPFRVLCQFHEFYEQSSGHWVPYPTITSSTDIYWSYDTYLGTESSAAYVWQLSLCKNNTAIATKRHRQNTVDSQVIHVDANNNYVFAEDRLTYEGSIWLNAGDVIALKSAVMYMIRKPETLIGTTDDITSVWKFYTEGQVPFTHYIFPHPFGIECTYNADSVQISQIALEPGFYENTPFDPTLILNEKTTKIDFITAIIKMFNLYIEDVSGKMNYKTGRLYPDKCLRIEPYDVYYHQDIQYGNNVHDWTDKIDWESVEYSRPTDQLYSTQKYTKKQNQDFFTEDYNKTYNLPFGEHSNRGPYCTSDKEVIEVPSKFGAYMCGLVNNQTDTIQCPKAFTITNKGEIDTKKEYADGIFFAWNNDTYSNTDIRQNYIIKVQSDSSQSSSNVTQYICADTLNLGYNNCSANLNWATEETNYQNLKGAQIPSNNLYNAFYKKQYEAMIAEDARVMKAKIYLTPLDIATLQLSDTIVVDGDSWRIVKIDQWKNAQTPCDIELLKVLSRVQ